MIQVSLPVQVLGSTIFIINKARYFDMFGSRLNDRQLKVALRLFQEGLAGFKGGLSAENYIRIAKTSRATTTRDLTEMVELGALRKQGKLRHTRYYLPTEEIIEREP